MVSLSDAIGDTLPWKPTWLPAIRAIDAPSAGQSRSRYTGHHAHRAPVAASLPLPTIQTNTGETLYDAAGRLTATMAAGIGQRIDLYV